MIRPLPSSSCSTRFDTRFDTQIGSLPFPLATSCFKDSPQLSKAELDPVNIEEKTKNF